MAAAEQLITANLDIWSSAIKAKSAAGRGSSKKRELYGIKKLRELVLELAVRGLLVPQDPKDEPARKLLKKIAAEKAKLVNDGKIKKQKALPPIEEDEKPFELPEGWEWGRFGNIYLLEYGDNLPQAKRSGTGEYSVFGSNGVVGTHDDFCVEKPCIVVGRKGSAGALNLCLDKRCWVTDVAYSLVPPECMSINFVFRQLHTLQLDSLGKGIKPGLSRNEAYALPIALPPFPEQARIVAKVDELMALCDQLEQQQETSITAHQTLVQTLLDALTTASERDGFTAAWARIADHFDTLFTTEWSIDQLKQTILQLAVMGKLVPQDPNDEPASELLKKIAAERAQLVKDGKIKKQKVLPPIEKDEKVFVLPEGWEWCKFGVAAEFINGDRSKNYPNKSEYVDAGVPWINTGHIEPDGTLSTVAMNFITREKFASLRGGKIEANDLVYCLRGATFGKTAFVTPYSEGAIASSLMIIRPHLSQLGIYIYRYLISPFGKRQLFRFDNGSAQPNLSANSVTLYAFPLPPLSEQTRIVAKVDELMALCDTLKTNLNTAQTTQLQLADAMAVA